MVDSNSLRRWIQNTLIGVGLFVVGAALAFGYSYRPLHGAMTWKVTELERRIDDRNLENQQMKDELTQLRSSEANRIDPKTFSQVERELDKTKKALAQAQKDLGRAETKRKEANSGASRWRKRYEELRDQLATAPASPAAKPTNPQALRDQGNGLPDSQPPASPSSPSPQSEPRGPSSPEAAERGMLHPDSPDTPSPIRIVP